MRRRLRLAALAEMEKSGVVRAGSRAALGRIGMGVAVRQGAPLPDLSTPDAFRKALLDAHSIVYADPAKGASSGIYFARLLERMGISDAVNRKATRLPGGYVAEPVAKGGTELGVHTVSEILPVKGVTLAGPLPSALQHYTSYAAATPTTAADAASALAFIKFITRPAAGAVWKKAGVEPAAARTEPRDSGAAEREPLERFEEAPIERGDSAPQRGERAAGIAGDMKQGGDLARIPRNRGHHRPERRPPLGIESDEGCRRQAAFRRIAYRA